MNRRLLTILIMVAGGLGAQAAAPARDNPATLPDYVPAHAVTGVLRIWGNPQMETLLRNWEEGFHRYQPGIFFTYNLKGTASAPFGLFESTADLAAMGRQIFTYEFYGIYRRSLLLPVEIAVATGSFDVPNKTFALTVFVHHDNPLARLTLAQLDGIFGAQRTGGWQGLKWNKDQARGPEKNLRTWGQLGLTGEWADRPIHVYGPPGIYPGGTSYFQTRVMGGADTWAEGLQEYADRSKMMEALSHDPLGIAYTGICYRTPQTKPLALAETAAGPYVEPTRVNVASRTYPLSRLVYLYFAPDQPSGEPADPKVDPKVREFLRYILSRQGQQAVIREGDYLPLTGAVLRQQLEKLD
ncbi:MAG: substrate-binding domain-containing protein [Opitutaceae bacterium]